jgi:hypothetical protein
MVPVEVSMVSSNFYGVWKQVSGVAAKRIVILISFHMEM